MLGTMNQAQHQPTQHQPARLTSPAATPFRQAPGPAPNHVPRRAPLRVLVVDDCSANRMLLTAVLMRWGIVPTMACDGAQAVRIAEQQAFDIVFMDMVMPEMDGVVATAKIRQMEREHPQRTPVPIIAYTSLDLSAHPEQLARVGLTSVLPKPCTLGALQVCLESWCPDRFGAH
jgi:two-component system sensor histidine kinase BarA